MMTIIVWAVGLHWQVTFNRADAKDRLDTKTLINYKHADYKGKGALYFFCKFLQVNCVVVRLLTVRHRLLR